MTRRSTDPDFFPQINGGDFGFQHVVVGDLQKRGAVEVSVVDPSAEDDEIHSEHVVQIVQVSGVGFGREH